MRAGQDRVRTGLMIAGLGAAVSGISALTKRRNRIGSSILGIGITQVALGVLDKVRE